MSNYESRQPALNHDELHTLIAQIESVPDDMLQKVLAAAICTYTARVEERHVDPFPAGSNVTASDVVIFATEILRAAELQPFELSMWQSWSFQDR